MTNEDMLDDLKQYIGLKTDTLGNSLRNDIVSELKEYVRVAVSEST